MKKTCAILIILVAILMITCVYIKGKTISDKCDFLSETIPQITEKTSIQKPTIHTTKTVPIIKLNILERKQKAVESLTYESGIFREKYSSNSGKSIEYMIRIPENAKTNMSLIVWLHGLNQYTSVLHHNMGVIKMAEELDEDRFIILQPSGTTSWYVKSQENLTIELIDSVIEKYQINPDRVILVGYSLGSVAAWQYAEHYPDKWAAVVPVSGQPFIKFDEVVNATVPIWAFWSNWDTKDNRDEMKNAIALMEKSGTHIELKTTIIKGVTHSDMAYLPFTQEFFDWAIMQKRVY